MARSTRGVVIHAQVYKQIHSRKLVRRVKIKPQEGRGGGHSIVKVMMFHNLFQHFDTELHLGVNHPVFI